MEIQHIVDAFKINYDEYWKSEDEISDFLTHIGYTEIKWYSSDFDSFGPLVRSIKAVNKQNEIEYACYG